MDIEKLRAENEELKEALKQSVNLEKIRMNRIFQLVDELEEAKTTCSKLHGIIYGAVDEVDEALRLDDVDEMCRKLREIRDILEG